MFDIEDSLASPPSPSVSNASQSRATPSEAEPQLPGPSQEFAARGEGASAAMANDQPTASSGAPRSEASNGADAAGPAEIKSDPIQSASQAPANGAPPKAEHSPRQAPPIEAPGASLIPYVEKPRAGDARSGGFSRVLRDRRVQWGAAAACLALIVAAAGATTLNQSADSQRLQAQALSQSIGALQAKIEAMEAAKPHEEAASIRRAVAEARGGLASTRDLTATIAQLSARIDRLEHDQETKADKLGERLDHDAASRGAETQAREADLSSRIEKIERADLATRLDKLEKKSATVAAATAPTAAPATPSPPLPPTLNKPAAPSPAVSNETTGSIERPQPAAPIRGWALREIRNGEALVESRQGLRAVSPGDVLAGAGRVERFEKRGHEWVVVTDQGVIVEGSPAGYNGYAAARPQPFPGPVGPYGAYLGGYGYGED